MRTDPSARTGDRADGQGCSLRNPAIPLVLAPNTGLRVSEWLPAFAEIVPCQNNLHALISRKGVQKCAVRQQASCKRIRLGYNHQRPTV